MEEGHGQTGMLASDGADRRLLAGASVGAPRAASAS